MIPLDDLGLILLGGSPATLPATLAALDEDARMDLHTATFDLNPLCVPYAGIHLFGEENFKRGELMAALARRMADAGLDLCRELPDHIGNLLRLLPCCPPDEGRELAVFCILGPLDKMVGLLPKTHPYLPVLLAARESIERAFPGIEAAPNPLEQTHAASPACGAMDACAGCAPAGEMGFDQEILTASVYA